VSSPLSQVHRDLRACSNHPASGFPAMLSSMLHLTHCFTSLPQCYFIYCYYCLYCVCLDVPHLFSSFILPACISDISPEITFLLLQLHLLKVGVFWWQTIRLFLFGWLFFESISVFISPLLLKGAQGYTIPSGQLTYFQRFDTIMPPCDFRHSDIYRSLADNLFSLSGCFKGVLSSMFGNFTIK